MKHITALFSASILATSLAMPGLSISGFGEDESGELYLTDLWTGSVYLITGRVASPTPRRPSGRVATSPR